MQAVVAPGASFASRRSTRLEHRQRHAIEAWDRFREERPEDWEQYLAESDALDRGTALPAEGDW